MTSTEKNILQYLLAADGINQLERAQVALDPARLKIDDRSAGDLVRFIYELSSRIRYYNLDLQQQGSWAQLFDLLHHGTVDLSDTLTDEEIEVLLQTRNDLPPHLALLFAFLRTFSYVQQDMNTLTAKRLRYYYEDVLQIKRKPAQPDQVHVLFEPAKNARPVLIKAGALLDAGKTSTGVPLQYALDNELVVSQTVVSELKSSYTDINVNGDAIVFKAPDARKVTNDTATAWRPFGSSQLPSSPETRSMEAVFFGWSIASPALLLAEGTRTITVSIALKNMEGAAIIIGDDDLENPLDLKGALQLSLSGEKGWLQPDSILITQLAKTLDGFQLEISASLNNTSPAVTAYNEAVHLAGLSAQWPVMRVLLPPENYLLELFSQFSAESISIEVAASGVKNLLLQNDQSVQPVDKPILPFGSSPAINSGFYIGSEEIFSKTLTSIKVNLLWEDPPDNFMEYYRTYYNSLNIENSSFKVNMELLAGRSWDTTLHTDIIIFDTTDARKTASLVVKKNEFANMTVSKPFKRSPGLQLPGEFSNVLSQGYMRLVLKSPSNVTLPEVGPFDAFGHKVYPLVYTQKAIELAKYPNTGDKPVLPKPPYTPTLKSVSLDYTAKEVFIPNQPNDIDQYFIQDVFGVTEVGKNDRTVLVQPQPGKGVLYIGLQQASLPQTVSMLFQVEEGNAVGNELLVQQDLHWAYLSGDRWIPIQAADIMEDSTNGLQQSGLIRLNIGADASLQHTLMPAGSHWLRVSVNSKQDGAGAIQAIATQAARATLVLPAATADLYETHLSAPLPPAAITKLVQKIPSIKKVQQPYPSFGGRNREIDNAYYRRVSERLRHKNRAVTPGDYEHLLLEYFPDIFKVKCLAHSGVEGVLMPGQIQLVVVPDWRKRKAGNPLQPMINQYQLREIASFISNNFCDPFVKLQVTNPVYETLLVNCKVNFHAAFDPGYYAVILEAEVKEFLSPWAYEEGRDIVFGGKVYASEIQAFIESREYVNNVVGFELYHQHQGVLDEGISNMSIGQDFIVGYSPEASIATVDTESGAQTGGKAINIDFVVGEPVETAAATRPDSILVSNRYHRIESLQAESTFCQGTQAIGISKMIIGLDFVTIS